MLTAPASPFRFPTPGTAAGGEPGIFAANAGRVGRAGSGSACPVPPGRWSNPRYLALLRVDAEALRRGRVAGEELCEITGVGPVPVSVAKDVLGEAILKLVITNGVDVANVTHLGRGPTTAQKIALMWTNPLCSVQGCHRRRIEYDHQKPWAETKHTRLDELDPLCGFHHDLKTRLHWALAPGTGKRPFVPPDDPRHPRYRRPRWDRSRSGGDAGEPTRARRNSGAGTVSASDRSVAAAGLDVEASAHPGRNDGNGSDPATHDALGRLDNHSRSYSPSRNHPRGAVGAARYAPGSVRWQRRVEIDADAVGIADGGVPLAPGRVERCDVGARTEGRQLVVQPVDLGWGSTSDCESEPASVGTGPGVLGEGLHHDLAVDHQADAAEITLEVIVDGAGVRIGQHAASGAIERDSSGKIGRDESNGVDHGQVIHAATLGPRTDSSTCAAVLRGRADNAIQPIRVVWEWRARCSEIRTGLPLCREQREEGRRRARVGIAGGRRRGGGVGEVSQT